MNANEMSAAMNQQIVYRDADLNHGTPLRQALDEASDLWRRLCADFVAKHGDCGTCVLGAGISVPYKAPRSRTVRNLIVIGVPNTAAQGSTTWESSVREVIALLAARGVVARYEPGNMD